MTKSNIGRRRTLALIWVVAAAAVLMALSSARPPAALAEGALRDVFNPNDPVNTLTRTACGAAQSLPSVAGNQVSSVICALRLAKYAYRTTYLMPSGTKIVRVTSADAGVPTSIDVNGEGVPDFTGVLVPTPTLNGVTLNIVRLPTTPAAWQVIIEAIAVYPAAPNTYVGFGEDGMAAGTEGLFSATATLLSDSAAGTEVKLAIHNASPLPARLTVQQSLATTPSTPVPGVVARVVVNAPDAQPTSMAVLGELFSGANPDAPTNVSRGDVSFASVPADLTTDVKLAPAGLDTTVTSSVPSTALAHLSLISPGDEKDVEATVDQIPTSAEVVYTNAGDHSKVIYTAAPGSAPIRNVNVRYHDRVGSSIVSAAAVDATSVPTGLTVDQIGAQTSLVTSGGAIGALEVRYGLGTDIPPTGSGTGPYVAYHRSETGTTAGVRLLNLQTLSVNAGNPYSADLACSQPFAQVALSAVDDVKGIALSGLMTNLPAHVSIGADLAQGKFSFDGYGTGIDELTLDSVSSNVLFGRVRRLHTDLLGIPPTVNLFVHEYPPHFVKQILVPATFAASIDNPVREVDLRADDDLHSAAVPGADSGLTYHDTPDEYAVAARVFGLKNVSVQKGPLDINFATAGERRVAVVDLKLQSPTDAQPLTLGATIDKLPSSLDFFQNPGGIAYAYHASDPIASLHLVATGLPHSIGDDLNVSDQLAITIVPLAGNPVGVPIHFSFTKPDTGPVQFDAGPGEQFGDISLTLENSLADDQTVLTGNEVAYTNLAAVDQLSGAAKPGPAVLRVHLDGLRSFSADVTGNAKSVALDAGDGGPSAPGLTVETRSQLIDSSNTNAPPTIVDPDQRMAVTLSELQRNTRLTITSAVDPHPADPDIQNSDGRDDGYDPNNQKFINGYAPGSVTKITYQADLPSGKLEVHTTATDLSDCNARTYQAPPGRFVVLCGFNTLDASLTPLPANVSVCQADYYACQWSSPLPGPQFGVNTARGVIGSVQFHASEPTTVQLNTNRSMDDRGFNIPGLSLEDVAFDGNVEQHSGALFDAHVALDARNPATGAREPISGELFYHGGSVFHAVFDPLIVDQRRLFVVDSRDDPTTKSGFIDCGGVSSNTRFEYGPWILTDVLCK